MTSPPFAILEGLIGLSHQGVDVRPTLLQVLTDLYIQKPAHSAEEERQYVELSLRLIEVVDAKTRATVAQKLAAYPAVPAAIAHALGIARREPELPPDAEMTRRESARTAADTSASGDAPEDMESARDVTDRFFAADEADRRRMLEAFAREDAYDDEPLAAASSDIHRRLETAVLAGRPSEFIRELEHALGISRALAQRVTNDVSGEPLMVAARALGMPIEVFQRVVLFVNPAVGHSVRRVYALSDLYQQVDRAAAARLVRCWQAAAGERRRFYAHAHGADEPRRDGPDGKARPDARTSDGRAAALQRTT